MRTLIIGLLAITLLIPSPVLAWGPRTHVEIAHRLGETNSDYLWGTVLPDYSLALRYAGHDYPNLQSVTHSSEFLEALWQTDATPAFIYGWEAHCKADEIETAYSRSKAGAPMSADWPVDQAFQQELPEVRLYHCLWIWDALKAVGVDEEVPVNVLPIYRMYMSYYNNDYEDVLDEWYSDYEDYVQDSVEYIGLRGDVNKDDVVNIVDAMLIAQYTTGSYNDVDSRADFNVDGEINIVDAMLIAQYTVGLYEPN